MLISGLVVCIVGLNSCDLFSSDTIEAPKENPIVEPVVEKDSVEVDPDLSATPLDTIVEVSPK